MTTHTPTSLPVARVTRVPLTPAPRRGVSPVTGGKRVAFFTAGGLVLVVAMGLMPVLGQLVG
ncbi:hypothetical protein IFT77_14970 [Frigoribacterium sp. CFBP 13729]|uniref:hypothetical protein n=1 Tax=Frigoribacterium sp. CFBP 13729 TaxID=2775293 RepID=UPI001786223C|nr:hypothetical protein [Frigoribacterium sp. CFBP 13729]MBD8611790.1 hypothetical protein [Frigoribacterium sp. CFBP 13729]